MDCETREWLRLEHERFDNCLADEDFMAFQRAIKARKSEHDFMKNKRGLLLEEIKNPNRGYLNRLSLSSDYVDYLLYVKRDEGAVLGFLTETFAPLVPWDIFAKLPPEECGQTASRVLRILAIVLSSSLPHNLSSKDFIQNLVERGKKLRDENYAAIRDHEQVKNLDVFDSYYDNFVLGKPLEFTAVEIMEILGETDLQPKLMRQSRYPSAISDASRALLGAIPCGNFSKVAIAEAILKFCGKAWRIEFSSPNVWIDFDIRAMLKVCKAVQVALSVLEQENPLANTNAIHILKSRQGACSICYNLAKSKCSRCGIARYCSVEHQKEAWSCHKHFCGKMTFEEFQEELSLRPPWEAHDSSK